MKKQSILLNWVDNYDACSPSRKWLYSFSPALTPQQAWDKCPNGNWLLWALCNIGVPPKLLLSAALVCAEGVQHHSKAAQKINKLSRMYIGRRISKPYFLDQADRIKRKSNDYDDYFDVLNIANCAAHLIDSEEQSTMYSLEDMTAFF
jgi:hypothetical protein